MIINLSASRNQSRIVWLAMGLGLFAAMAYLLLALNVLTVGNLNLTEAPLVIVCLAALCYLAVGLLILSRDRWLLLYGALINAMMILFFFELHQDHLTPVTLSPGMVTKVAQLLLEGVLICLIVAGWQKRIRAPNKPISKEIQ